MTTLRFYTIVDGELIAGKVHENLRGYGINQYQPAGTFYTCHEDEDSTFERDQLCTMQNKATVINPDPLRYILTQDDNSRHVIQVDKEGAELINIDGRTLDVVYGLLETLAFGEKEADIRKLVDVSLRKGIEGVLNEIKFDTYKVLERLPE